MDAGAGFDPPTRLSVVAFIREGANFRVLSDRFTELTLLRLAAQHREIVSVHG